MRMWPICKGSSKLFLVPKGPNESVLMDIIQTLQELQNTDDILDRNLQSCFGVMKEGFAAQNTRLSDLEKRLAGQADQIVKLETNLDEVCKPLVGQLAAELCSGMFRPKGTPSAVKRVIEESLVPPVDVVARYRAHERDQKTIKDALVLISDVISPESPAFVSIEKVLKEYVGIKD